MGSGSSSRKSTPECNTRSMPEPTQGGQKGPRRGRRQFEEVQLQDPDAPQRASSDASTGAGAVAGAGASQTTTPRVAPPAQPGYQGQQAGHQGAVGGGGGGGSQWQNAGNQVQTGQQVLNQFQTYKQAKLEAQPGQNPDEFFSMALQLQEMGDEGIIFGTYYHPNGKQYPCIQQANKRFYLDSWDTQEWRPYPESWNGFGYFVKDGDPIPDEAALRRGGGGGMYQREDTIIARSLGDIDVTPGLGGSLDDRAGTLKHPTKGTLLTYVFEEKRNIHCYFDEDSGMWVKMPVAWEQHTSFVKPLVAQIQETVPTWKDKYDVIASLRQSNYDPDDVISTYFTIGDTGAMDSPDRIAGMNKKMIKEKDDKIASLQEKFLKLKQMYETAATKNKKLHSEYQKIKKDVGKMREQVSGLEVDLKTANMKIETLKQERPSTATRKQSETLEIETAESDPEPDSSTFESDSKKASPKKQPPPPPSVPQGPVIDPETLKKVDLSAKELDKCQLTLKKEVKDGFEELTDLVKQAMDGLSQMKTMDAGSNQELDDLKVLYKKECLQRKLLYNKLQEIRGNIRVFCRVRYDSRTECALKSPSDQDIMATNPAGKRMSYSFDRVFMPSSRQTEVFQEALPVITSCIDGYNVCIMAYGQTGAGKTYTMMGTKSDPGVNVRAIQELLKICAEKDQITYKLKVSMLEVYNEHLQDLLTSKDAKENLDIKMNGKKLVVNGLTEVEVTCEDDITRVMDTGDANRSVAATKMNSTSSRSHLLLMLFVEGINKVSKATSYGSLTLVDLAGSERIAKTGATGQTLVEAAAINKSLTALGQVFTCLRTSALHVPYRNSKLTHLLQPSLGGDAKACLFVNVSPDVNNIQETISTLTFGSGAKQVALGQATKNTGKGK